MSDNEFYAVPLGRPHPGDKVAMLEYCSTFTAEEFAQLGREKAMAIAKERFLRNPETAEVLLNSPSVVTRLAGETEDGRNIGRDENAPEVHVMCALRILVNEEGKS